MVYSPAVERWRPFVAKYFRPEDVDKALWVVNGESGGDASASGDGGASVGLFQLNDRGLGSGMSREARLDPETNIRTAAAAVYGGSGWKPWGENNAFNGKKFGALGNNPYPGGTARMPDDEAGPIGAPGAGTTIEGAENDPASVRAQVWRAIVALMTRQPAESAFNTLDEYDQSTGKPTGRKILDRDALSKAQTAWAASMNSLRSLYDIADKDEQGIKMITLPDGTLLALPSSQLDDATRKKIDDANELKRAQLFDSLGLSDWNTRRTSRADVQGAAQDAFDNAIKRANTSLAYDRGSLENANTSINRMLNGLQESRARSQMVTEQTLKAAPWATQPGKTSFSGGDLGAVASAFAQFLGLDPQAGLINYPTTLNVDPQGLLNQYDERFGIQGQLPQVPGMITSPESIQGIQAPQVLPPVAPPELASLATFLNQRRPTAQQPGAENFGWGLRPTAPPIIAPPPGGFTLEDLINGVLSTG